MITGMKGFANGGPLAELLRGTSRCSIDEYSIMRDRIMADNRRLVGDRPVSSDHREIDPKTGQQKDYVVLSAEERAKGFIRPVRRSYVHTFCGAITTMHKEIAETYARDPSFYDATFCVQCGKHFALDQFTWLGYEDRVGS